MVGGSGEPEEDNDVTTPIGTTLDCDVVVVGAGAGGLSAAVTAAHHGLRVVVLERAEVCGGATAWSGGWAWAPGNPLAHADGVVEEPEQFRSYLRSALGAQFEPARVEAFLEAAPRMVRFFHEHTALTFVPGAKVCDIYGELPGAGTGHRSVAPAPIDARELGADVRRLLRGQLYETSFLGMGVMAGPDLAGFLAAARGNLRGLAHATRRVLRHAVDLVRYRRGMQLVNGTALIGRLLRAALDLGVDIRVLAEVEQLRQGPDGRVVGVRASTPAGPLEVSARRGVVLAAGGFPRDAVRRAELFPAESDTGPWPRRPPTAPGSASASPPAGGCAPTWPPRSPGARCRWCPTAAAGSGCSRTSWTGPSRAASGCCEPGAGS